MTLKEHFAKTPKRAKYKNQKVKIDGMTFDSTAEAARYLELRRLEVHGVISDLKCQVPFELVPKNGSVRAVKYVSDFTYNDRRLTRLVIEDVKGVLTGTFKIKAKLMNQSGFSVSIIKREDINTDYLKLAKDIRELGLPYSTK